MNIAVYPLPRLIRMLESGELDMAMMLAKSPSWASTLVYSSQPVFVAKPVLVLAATNTLRRVERADDFLGLRIGTWSAGYLPPMLRDARLVTQPIGGDSVAERHLRMLGAGHIDAFYSPDQCSVSYALRLVQATSSVRQLAMPDREAPLYAVFSHEGARRWSASYEAAFSQLQGRAGYARLLGHRCADSQALAELEAGDEFRARGATLSLSAGLTAE